MSSRTVLPSRSAGILSWTSEAHTVMPTASPVPASPVATTSMDNGTTPAIAAGGTSIEPVSVQTTTPTRRGFHSRASAAPATSPAVKPEIPPRADPATFTVF
ncbi:hypothetical protein [Streptomyces murinus]|uniref:Uncharacterized protein n=1 Tax=Streptomyces murinus TaxID=33900 RepID=A0A7W3NI72_STRMR|nr:hypothetical protein [Streptomyces murinus]MBA9050995.1 hypothetical protein [Streptomyces murinus]